MIPYVPLSDHHDPLFEEFTYGGVEARAQKLKRDLKQGDFVLFHTTLKNRRYITAYYVVDKVLDTSEAATNKAIVSKYKNPHIEEYLKGDRRTGDDVVIFGDTILSRRLERPLGFTRELSEKLSLDIPFNEGYTENQCISSATRQWRRLTNNDIDILLSKIEKAESEGYDPDAILSTDEVLEIREVDLENFIVRNSGLIGRNLKLVGRQIETPTGRLDLLFADEKGDLIVVELKLNEVGTGALNQLRRYMREVKKGYMKNTKGVLVCKDVLPVFVENFKRLKDIQVVCFGWKLSVREKK